MSFFFERDSYISSNNCVPLIIKLSQQFEMKPTDTMIETLCNILKNEELHGNPNTPLKLEDAMEHYQPKALMACIRSLTIGSPVFLRVLLKATELMEASDKTKREIFERGRKIFFIFDINRFYH